MYEAFFNLKTKPFSLLPDPDFLFLSSRHAVALSLLDYSLSGQAGFCVITGEIGSGKTTLVRAFLSRVGREFTVGLISNTHSALRDMAAWALGAFGQKPNGGSPAETYQELIAFLIAEYGAGRQCILIVDESQNLTIEALEELRLLSNINSGKDLLLQIVLVGQPELLDKLRRPELNQFAQRIAVSHHLTALPYAETKRYIEHRLKVSGAEQPIFTEMAMGGIQYFSGGVPRLINSICDMALVYAFADAVTTITEDLVFRVVSDRQGSGIAPYARTDSADDPAVRAEILNLARSGTAMTTGGRATAEAKAEQAHGRNTKTAGKAKPAIAAPAEAAAVPADKPEEQPVSVPVAVAKPIETAKASETATPTEVAAPANPEAAAAGPTPEAKSIEVKPAPVLASEAVAADPKLPDRQDDDVPGPNPYFFRESTEEEELLLTTEVIGQPANGAEPTSVRPLQAPEAAKTSEPETHSLKIASDSDQAAAKDLAPPAPPALAPSPEPNPASVERIPVAAKMRHEPETANADLQLGTATPTRRSWWRRRLARGN